MSDIHPHDDPQHRAETSRGGSSATDELRDQVRIAAEDLRVLGHRVMDAARELLGDAKSTAADYRDRARERAELQEERLVEMVRERPIKSLLTAAGVGALLALLLRGR